jgi:alanyl-tRNA synthetase
MTNPSLTDVRHAFLRFFEANGHTSVASAPLVPDSDPSLLFTNAGMVPFKPVFLGKASKPYKRAASSQKCVRAGGKHNDLDNVGYTARHHTFFEMLGNFSFADYFKEEAILYAWRLLTDVFALPKEKLCVTVYHTDAEARGLWRKISGLPEEKIISIATNDNFWSMGDTGPCGPCSEIFYDHGEGVFGGPPGSKDQDGDRFMEIWNLVFMQHERFSDGAMVDLPSPCIDTGMGLERVGAVLQGVHDNYDTDLFRRLIGEFESVLGIRTTPENKPSFKALADHIRSVSFLMADGIMPGNEGRGYVLRRIIRRAVRHAYMLGKKEPAFHRAVGTLSELMGEAYPELRRAEASTTQLLRLEEEKFLETLGRGLDIIGKALPSIPEGGELDGFAAFKLYDTYGFPLDLTQDVMRSHGRGVDTEGFDKEMAEQKRRARAAWKGSGDAEINAVRAEIRERAGATEFLGYLYESCDANVLAVVKNSESVETASEGDAVEIVLNQTPFYGESGGQEGDRGVLEAEGVRIRVRDTKKLFGDLHVHYGEIEEGVLRVGASVTARIDRERRQALRRSHTATHILHAALRDVLGTHLTQKGSLVAEDRLRFDFSHPKATTEEELRRVEADANAVILRNVPLSVRIMKAEDALQSGAMALFGEKYGDEVRVVSVGEGDAAASVELCGGTHAERSGDIGLLKIVSESAVASGIRRIEAYTGKLALAAFQETESLLKECARAAKSAERELPLRIKEMAEQRKASEKALADLKKQNALLKSSGTGESAGSGKEERIGGCVLVHATLEGADVKQLRDLALAAVSKRDDAVALYAGTTEDGKISVVVAVSAALQERIGADALVDAVKAPIGAKGGGGKKGLAQTGGTEAGGRDKAVEAVRERLRGL